METEILFLTVMIVILFLLYFSGKLYNKQTKKMIEDNKELFPELELLGDLYKKDNFNKRTENSLIMKHHLRCMNYEALKGDFNMVNYHNEKYKEEHLKLFGC